MSLKDSDDAAKAVQKTPYRISLAYIESQIGSEEWLTVSGQPHMTVVVLQLLNGFSVIGKSAPADPENYDADLGRRFAREDAIRQCWPLFAFALLTEQAEISVMEDLRKLAAP